MTSEYTGFLHLTYPWVLHNTPVLKVFYLLLVWLATANLSWFRHDLFIWRSGFLYFSFLSHLPLLFNRKCALSGLSRACRHRIKLGDSGNYYYISPSCRARVSENCIFSQYKETFFLVQHLLPLSFGCILFHHEILVIEPRVPSTTFAFMASLFWR